MRLIDADAFREKFRNGKTDTKEEMLWNHTVRRMIEEQPTAFDMDAVIEQFHNQLYCYDISTASNELLDDLCVVESLYDAINKLPTVDAVPVVKGKWLYNDFIKEWECSNCHSSISLSDDRNSHPNYCPQCGCDMRKKVK